MYELLKAPAEREALTRPAGIEYRRVFDTVKETGGHHFLHGVAVREFEDKLAVCFALNMVFENTIGEELWIRWSADQGKTWSAAERITPPDSEVARSHSVFLEQDGKLWCLVPLFRGWGDKATTRKGHKHVTFVDLKMETWSLEADGWKNHGVTAEGFWPLSEPVRTAEGNWLVTGCDEKWLGVVAISHGDDLMHWDVIHLDTEGDVLTEAGAWVDGNRVMVVLRNESLLNDGKYPIVVTVSEDGGRTYGPMQAANLAMATTKPFCGYLSDGRPYLVYNESVPGAPKARDRMMLGIGQKGTFTIDKVYVLDEGTPKAGGKRAGLSYPYARQIGDRLYVAYSFESAPGTGCNHNDAMLAIVDVADL